MTSFTDISYTVDFCAVRDLEPAIRTAMERIYLAHYAATSPEIFRHDLAEKNEVFLVRHKGELVGFTTILVYPFEWEGKEIRVVFSGDTVVDRQHWGQQALFRAGIARMGQLARECPKSPLYWFLLVKGHRTYKYLHVGFQRFFPHWERDEPDLSRLASALAHERFGSSYREADGLVVFTEARGQLMPDIAEPEERERNKAPVRFFLKQNPGYRQGHELVCLCLMAEDNLRPLMRRIFLKNYYDHG